MKKNMNIVHLAAEYAPLVKIGGLADVVEGLFTHTPGNIEVIIPKYSHISNEGYFKTPFKDFSIFSKDSKNKKISLIDIPPLFSRKNIYGYKDDPKRFLTFTKAALQYLLSQKNPIDVLHLHDWHTALGAALYKDIFFKKNLKIKKIVLTIHNAKYQGECPLKIFKASRLNPKKYKKPFFKKINLLSLGISSSDAVVTVSSTYAKEILMEKDKVSSCLKKNKKKLTGILNGIDTDIWSPQKDPFIFKKFSKKDPIEKILTQKSKNKKYLQEKLQMEITKKPLICFIGRLVPQKGIPLLVYAMRLSCLLDFQFVLLGSSSIPTIQKKFYKLKKKWKHKKNISLNFAFDEKLAHEIYASADFILIPSLFEPCGLVQMIAFAYGTIPIARKTGGLADTVRETNGFTFQKYNKKAMKKAIIKACNLSSKKSIIKNCLLEDHSFNNCAKKYLHLYKTF